MGTVGLCVWAFGTWMVWLGLADRPLRFRMFAFIWPLLAFLCLLALVIEDQKSRGK